MSGTSSKAKSHNQLQTDTRRFSGTPSAVASEIRRALKNGGSAEHASGVQRYFKEEIKSHGWYAADLRAAMRNYRRRILKERDFSFLVQVADGLFSGTVLEEKVAAVLLLESLESKCGDGEFRLFEDWLDRISSWADHDGLVHDLIAPMMMAKPARVKLAFRWAKSADRWHRRAACVALTRGVRVKMFFPQVVRLSNFLLADQDDMVQKGLGWLLRETAKFDAKRTVPYLMKIRERAPRLVLRTACETLPAAARKRVLMTASQKKLFRNSSATNRCAVAGHQQTSGIQGRASRPRQSR